eukprot:Skav222283  [mRNA]  locus=scaffold807:209856:211074:- [translate_table: standard]
MLEVAHESQTPTAVYRVPAAEGQPVTLNTGLESFDDATSLDSASKVWRSRCAKMLAHLVRDLSLLKIRSCFPTNLYAERGVL